MGVASDQPNFGAAQLKIECFALYFIYNSTPISKILATPLHAVSLIHLSGEVDCPHFKPYMLKANLCVDCSYS